MLLSPPSMSTPNGVHPLIINYMQPRQCTGLVSVMVWAAAEGWTGFYQADCLCCHPLDPGWVDYWRWGGEWGLVEPSVPGTWRLLAVAYPSTGGVVGRLVAPGCIGYSTVYVAALATQGGRSSQMKIFSDNWCPLSQTDICLTQVYNCSGNAKIYLVQPETTSTDSGTAAIAWSDLIGLTAWNTPGSMPTVGIRGSPSGPHLFLGPPIFWVISPGSDLVPSQGWEGGPGWSGEDKLQ